VRELKRVRFQLLDERPEGLPAPPPKPRPRKPGEE
jgi:hypothetical protein